MQYNKTGFQSTNRLRGKVTLLDFMDMLITCITVAEYSETPGRFIAVRILKEHWKPRSRRTKVPPEEREGVAVITPG